MGTLTEKTWGRSSVVLVVKTKMAEQPAEHFTRFTTNYCLKTSDGQHLLFGV